MSESEPQHKETQLERVRSALQTGQWLTLPELAHLTTDPISSISATLRHLRKPEHGAHTIRKRRRGEASRGLYEYRLLAPQRVGLEND